MKAKILIAADGCCLASDPSNPDVVHAETQKVGMLHSDDRGETWQKLPYNLGSIHRRRIML